MHVRAHAMPVLVRACLELGLLAGEDLVDLDVLGAGLFDDVLGQLDGGLLVELDVLKVVTDNLLVKGVLAVALLVLGSGPEAGAIGGEDLIGQTHLTLLVEAELER